MKKTQFARDVWGFTKEEYIKALLSLPIISVPEEADAKWAEKAIYEDGEKHLHHPLSLISKSGAIYVFRTGNNEFRLIGRNMQNFANKATAIEDIIDCM